MEQTISNIKGKHVYSKNVTLAKLPQNKEAIIIQMDTTSPISVYLMEMGIIPGEKIKIIRKAPLGDPIEIQVMGYKLCIRKSEAKKIEVKYED